MGRKGSGVYNTHESSSLELSFLKKKGLLPSTGSLQYDLKWGNGNVINVQTNCVDGSGYIRLSYTIVDNKTGVKQHYNYEIEVVSFPSNLGKGQVSYFICPHTGLKCRILYLAYDSNKWMSRKAYNERIYYPLQQCSKLDKYHVRYQSLKNRLCSDDRKRTNSVYKGQTTKTAIKLELDFIRLGLLDNLRWSELGLPKEIIRAINKNPESYRY